MLKTQADRFQGNSSWTPHSGYHWEGLPRRFFEGWYFRLTLPAVGESFAFMYSVDDPAGDSPLSGGAAQILGPEEQYLYCPFPGVEGFWAWRHRLGLGHWGKGSSPPAHLLDPATFFTTVDQGYQVTTTEHQGCLQDPETGAIARWHYTVDPLYGWGDPQKPALPTAGWLSYLPILEPGWQVLLAHGLATGWMEWQGQRYEFAQAPVYAEKNWGGAFPEKWFWIQSNAFPTEPDLTLTMAGARRRILNQMETVGLLGLHHRGQFLALSSLNAQVSWTVQPWGDWRVSAANHRYRVEMLGQCDRPPAQVRVPTLAGLHFGCWDTTHGTLRVKVWARSPHPCKETQILDTTTPLAGLEVGGSGWDAPWQR